MSAPAHDAILTAFRTESPKLVGALTRIVRDLDMAEELAQDALVAALQNWPDAGIPENPGAWLMATARRRALDLYRHGRIVDRKSEELGYVLSGAAGTSAAEIEDAVDDPFEDDLLRLIFVACHPVLPTEARIALTLRLLGGLTTKEIARAYLVPEPTVAQRIVRAKKLLTSARVPYEVPRGGELEARLPSVLEVIYLVFNEGYSATTGDDWMRPMLVRDALRLGHMLARLLPDEASVHGLVALMEIQSSRSTARVGPGGVPVLLLEQDRTKWDKDAIARGTEALARAESLSGEQSPYVLQAAIAACHARATTAEATDWKRIAELYDALAAAAPSPIVELNRAVAVAMAYGPARGLAIADALLDEPALEGYHLLPSVRGDLLMKLGRLAEAKTEFERAASLTENARERTLLLERAAACSPRQ